LYIQLQGCYSPLKKLTFIVRRGVSGYRGGADGMAWEATAGNWRRRWAAALGFGGLLVVRFAAGAAEAVGEKPLERVLPLDRK